MLFLFRSNFVFQSYILRVVVRTARTKHNKKSDPKRESIPEISVFLRKKIQSAAVREHLIFSGVLTKDVASY